MENQNLADKYQPLFDFMIGEYGLILTKGEMDEIISKAVEFIKKDKR